eukprot:7671296-Pyramimonas_sp.AAC.1
MFTGAVCERACLSTSIPPPLNAHSKVVPSVHGLETREDQARDRDPTTGPLIHNSTLGNVLTCTLRAIELVSSEPTRRK